MFEMLVGAYKGDRKVVFGDLFSGFRKSGSYALYGSSCSASRSA
jgi:hypothetical protein